MPRFKKEDEEKTTPVSGENIIKHVEPSGESIVVAPHPVTEG